MQKELDQATAQKEVTEKLLHQAETSCKRSTNTVRITSNTVKISDNGFR